MNGLLFLCLKIFFGRIVDVSLATLRTVLTVKEKHAFAAMIGFFEIAVWFVIVQEALTLAKGDIWIVLAYAGGFAAGTFTGGLLSSLIVKSYVEIRIVTAADVSAVTGLLYQNGFGVTAVRVDPSVFSGARSMLIVQARMKEESRVRALVSSVDPDAFITVDETKLVFNGYLKQ